MIKTDLYNGDCITVMQELINKEIKVDSVITDIPYGTTSCSWDEIIPFNKMWECLEKITKPNAPIILFSSQPFQSKLIMSKLEWFREDLIWLKNKPASGMQSNQKHMKIHENICVFSKDSSYTYNPQKWLISDKEFITQRKTFKENEYVSNQIYGATHRTRKVDTGERNPISILSCQVPFTSQKSKTYSNDIDLRYHPTQKPLALMDYLVNTFSTPNDIVLDFTMGSGSTGVACVNTNRNFIGIELDNNYFDIAEKRIKLSEETTNSIKQDVTCNNSKNNLHKPLF